MAGAAIGGVIIGQVAPAKAQLGDILKGGGIIFVVDRLAGPINQGINALTGNKNSIRDTTKVVPILSLGQGTYVGAAQVSGPKNQVDQVKALAQVEGEFDRFAGGVRARALIPVSVRSVKDLKSLSRVRGVGVSALVDVKL